MGANCTGAVVVPGTTPEAVASMEGGEVAVTGSNENPENPLSTRLRVLLGEIGPGIPAEPPPLVPSGCKKTVCFAP